MHWAAPRMRQPQRIRAELQSDQEAAEFLTLHARCSGPQDLSGLVELQLFGKDGDLVAHLLATFCQLAVRRARSPIATPLLTLGVAVCLQHCAMALEGMLRQAREHGSRST